VVVRTRSGEVIKVAPGDVVSVRELSDAPVRASAIRAVEHAAALAWPGLEHRWLGGWFLRAANGSTSRANSAVPLDFSASLSVLDEVADWYARRGLPAWLALPERLVPVRGAGVKQTRVMVRDISDCSGVTLLDGPDADWLTIYERPVPIEVLTAVVDGTVTFAVLPETAVGRGAVTLAPDGTRWLGISSLRVATERRRQGHARAVCSALLQWGAARGATRVYVQVLSENTSAITLYHSMGFRLHHHLRYIDAAVLLRPTL
jgi:GNAT superfamily N-acetyltransferase